MYIEEKIKRSHTRISFRLCKRFLGARVLSLSLTGRKNVFYISRSSARHANVTCYIKMLNTSSDVDEINILSRAIYMYILV